MKGKGNEENWAEIEFGDAELGDKRRTARLVQLASQLGEHPQGSLPDAAGDPAVLKAAYRFFDNQDIEVLDMLASHIRATYQRMAKVDLVLAVQDTTYLDWTAHPGTTGLGPLVTAERQGLLAHSTLAFTVERVPLGVLAQQVWARDGETFGQLEDHKARRIEEKESSKWLRSLEALREAQKECPNTHLVSVGDREADIYDLFLTERPTGVDLLVRAAMDRRVEQAEKYLWAALEAMPLAATVKLNLPARNGQPARIADMQVRWRQVTLCPPLKRSAEKLPKVTMWAVLAVEKSPPPDIPSVEWLLLTTISICTAEEALEKLDWYACRWGIEVWHKVLKSGCRIEARQLENADRLKRCLTLYSVIAWRVMYATMLARAVPDLPCIILLNEPEWQALYCTIHNTAMLPQTPPSLAQSISWIAQLGGFLGRKRDGKPGVTVMWKGFQHLSDLSRMYRILHPFLLPQNVGND